MRLKSNRKMCLQRKIWYNEKEGLGSSGWDGIQNMGVGGQVLDRWREACSINRGQDGCKWREVCPLVAKIHPLHQACQTHSPQTTHLLDLACVSLWGWHACFTWMGSVSLRELRLSVNNDYPLTMRDHQSSKARWGWQKGELRRIEKDCLVRTTWGW